MLQTNDRGETFEEWLAAQKHSDRAIGDLAMTAMADRKFPRQGFPDNVRNWLNDMHGEGNMHGIVYDAVSDWKSY